MDIIGYKDSSDNEFIQCAKKYPGVVSYLGSASNPAALGRIMEKALPSPKLPPKGGSKPPISEPPSEPPSEPKVPGWVCTLKTLMAILVLVVGAIVIGINLMIKRDDTQGMVIRITMIATIIVALATTIGAIPCE